VRLRPPPIRVRLTAWYAGVLAVILVALGAFVVIELRAHLRDTLDGTLGADAREIARGYVLEGVGDFRDVSRTVLPADGTAQLLDTAGRVLSSIGAPAGRTPMLSDARSAVGHTVTARLGASGQRYRVVATPVRHRGRDRMVVVAESLHDVDRAANSALTLLLIGGPVALLATAAGGWWLARQSLRPVDRMAATAEAIRIDHLNERIPVVRAGDELGRLAVTFNAMLDRVESGVDERRRLIADASHDLRTPLAAMRTELDVQLRDPELPPSARTVLESNREEVALMSRMVDNLLTLAQADDGHLDLLKTDVDVDHAIETAVRPLRPLADVKGVVLEVDGDAGATRADAQRLHQALTNLVDNAIKFTPAGGRVTVTGWRTETEAGVTVSDTGPGIPDDAREQIFERFYRVDPARGRDVPGSGLGLAICREIAAAHGGRLWVEGREGEGSAFSLALPLDRVAASAPA
jgi:heavy metal sensor kinase